MYKNRSSLRKLIRKLRIFITNKKVRKKRSSCIYRAKNWRSTRAPPLFFFTKVSGVILKELGQNLYVTFTKMGQLTRFSNTFG